MNRITALLLLLQLSVIPASMAADSKPVALRCDHLFSPVGIDNEYPRLSWKLEDHRPGAMQKAYRVIVGADSSAVVSGRGTMWDSGEIETRDMLVTYDGVPLEPFSRYYWSVTVRDMNGELSTSPVAAFETGMMDVENWQGSWIADPNDINYGPAHCFRKEFDSGKEISSARAYIAVAGLYELYINGERIGDHFLDPVYTRFDRRNIYVAHDVTDCLQRGRNAVGVMLGNGWYNHQSIAVWNFERAPWRDRPAFCLDLHVTYTDGSSEVVSTDLDWKTAPGPVIWNSIYTGGTLRRPTGTGRME